MLSNGFELAVEVDGRRIPEYGHRGRTFVEGRRGSPYQIKFRNQRPERVLVVPSVDGLSVLDGNPAVAESPGYAVHGYSSLTLTGWRTSLSEVRQFEFGEKAGSYAGRSQGQQNCGVIGLIVYGEKPAAAIPAIQVIQQHTYLNPPPPLVFTPYYGWQPGWVSWSGSGCVINSAVGQTMSSGANVAATNYVSQTTEGVQQKVDFNLGTAYGRPLTDMVNYVAFERGPQLATLEIYYSDREGLLRDGIAVDKTPELALEGYPRAFGGFCKPPA